MGRLIRAVATLVVPFAMATMGCAGGQTGMLEGTTVTKVRAPGPGPGEYRTDASGEAVVGPAAPAAAVARGVARAAETHGVTVEGDGRLGRLAAWIADHLGEGATPPPHAVIEFFAHHLGLVEPTPHLLILGHPDESGIEDAMARSAGQFLARQPYTHFGATVVERQGLLLTVVALSARHVELSPVPRRVAAGVPIVVEGTLLGGHRGARVVVARPDGELERLPAGDDGTALRARVKPRSTGAHAVEVLAQGPLGDRVIANFPVYVGVDPPAYLDLGADADDAAGEGHDVGAALLRLLNRTRTEAGLGPLKPNPGLAQVAEAHSRDMVDHGFVGHTSPTTGTAPERVTQAGFASGLILENIGRGYGPQEIHRGLMQSPGHRANILNPDVTDVGIGVVSEGEGDRTAFVVTQVFTRTGVAIDVNDAPEAVLARLNRGRRGRGAPPLRIHDALQKAAQDGAERYFDDLAVSQADVVEGASDALEPLSHAFRRVGGVMVVVSSLDDASQVGPRLAADLQHVGIGVAQGSRPGDPPNSIAIVVMMGWPR
jgi:uncharacterized protein YkwD